jgi:Uma2 family endonuclease
MSTQTIPFLTPEQYLEIERKAECKSEYIDGAMFAMAGASLNHVRIVTNAILQLGPQLRSGPCEVFTTDLRLFIQAVRVFTYPDIMVTCGPADKEPDAVVHPRFIAEVLSDSPKNYDRGEKFRFYRTISGFSDYLLLAQDSVHAEHYQRQPDGAWILREFTLPEDHIQLDSIECRLELGALYDRVVFGENQLIQRIRPGLTCSGS